MSCLALTAFRTATESLDQRIQRSQRLGRKLFWKKVIPFGEFVKNQGVTRSTFQIKASEPQDDSSLWTDITLSGGHPSPACATDFEEVGVGFFERTYGPKQRQFMGPVICADDLTFKHQPGQFLNDYQDEMGRYNARVWEFTLRADYLSFGNIYIDGTKHAGPNALAGALPRAFQGLTQDSLDDMASEQIDLGAGSEPGGYTMLGEEGPIFPLEIDKIESRMILKANSTIREDARYAAMGKGADSDLSFFKAIGATRVIGNFRHMVTNVAVRLNYTSGAYTVVSPFKDVADIGSDGDMLTQAYKDADFELAIPIVPTAFRADIVTPENWRFPNTQNYNGEWQFKVGGNLVCNPAEFDPLEKKGRHFAEIKYAPAPLTPYHSSAILYKRCEHSSDLLYCS